MNEEEGGTGCESCLPLVLKKYLRQECPGGAGRERAGRLHQLGQPGHQHQPFGPCQRLDHRRRDGGLLFVMAISDGSSLAVLAAPECDTDLVSYEMTLLVEAVGDVLTPAARTPQ
jgi:hypothetical protein